MTWLTFDVESSILVLKYYEIWCSLFNTFDDNIFQALLMNATDRAFTVALHLSEIVVF